MTKDHEASRGGRAQPIRIHAQPKPIIITIPSNRVGCQFFSSLLVLELQPLPNLRRLVCVGFRFQQRAACPISCLGAVLDHNAARGPTIVSVPA
jgi:hypothetical protein